MDPSEYEWVVECPFDPPHTHTFPYDWFFGGPEGSDFRADARWRPSVYVYMSENLEVLHTTSAPGCDDEAIDGFTTIANYGKGFNPRWLRVRRPDGTSHTIPVIYYKKTDEVFET